VNNAGRARPLIDCKGQKFQKLFLAFREKQNDKTLPAIRNCAIDEYLFLSAAYFDILELVAP